MELINKEIPIDTWRNGNHVRHMAVVDERRVARTKCGRKVIMFFDAIQTSWFCTDGTRASKPCKFCFPNEYAEYLSENPAAALRAISSEKRSQASRENGKKGGRPKKS